MILNEREMQMARELARDLVRVKRKREIEEYRLKRARQAQETREAFESFGRAVRNVQNAYFEGIYKPLSNAMKAMNRGYHS